MRSAEAYSWGKCNNVTSVCRGTDLVKYAVTKGTLTMASTAWMKGKDDRAVALVMQPMLEVKSV